MKKRILVTGATGFVGQNLVPCLKRFGKEVEICVPCRDVEKGKNMFPEECVIPSDSYDEIKRFNPHITIHLAGYITSSDDTKEIEPLIDANLKYGAKLLDALSHCSAMQLFVNTGSFSEYDERHNFCSAYLYSATKSAFRPILEYYAGKAGFRYATAVLYSVYGGKQTIKRIMDYMMEALDAPVPVDMTPGEQRLDFIHMDDVCDFFTTIVRRAADVENGKDFHVGKGKTSTLKDLASVIEEVTGKRANINWGGRNYRPNDIMYACAPKETIDEIGWKARTDLREGVNKMINARI